MNKNNKRLSETFLDVIHGKYFEPIKRKHGNFVEEWQRHRFPIKNGISWRETYIRDMSEPNLFLKAMFDRKNK